MFREQSMTAIDQIFESIRAIDQNVDIAGALFFLIIGVWATAYAYGLVGSKMLGGVSWRPEFQRQLRWLGLLLVLACVGSLVFTFR